MGLTRALRAQFHEVVVVLNEGKKTAEDDELLSAVQGVGIQADRVDHEVDPFVGGELAPLLDVVHDIHVGDLDGLEALDEPALLDLVAGLVGEGDDAPDTVAGQELGIPVDDVVTDGHGRDGQVREGRLVDIAPVIEHDRHLVDDTEAAVLADLALDLLGLGAVDIVVADDILHLLQPLGDDLFIVRGAVLTQQVFQYVGRDRKVALHEEGEVLAYHLPDEGFHDLGLQFFGHIMLKVLFDECSVVDRHLQERVDTVIHVIDAEL